MPEQQRSIAGIHAIDFINASGDPGTVLEALSAATVKASVARRFQHALRRIFRAESDGGSADERDLALLNRILAGGGSCRGLRPTVAGYGWGWIAEPRGEIGALWPVAWSAARILAAPESGRLKHCEECGRFFLDVTRNHSRRWCDMQACGNRVKARRHRARSRSRRLA